MMFTITLPDGSTRQYAKPLTGADLAKDIAPSLAKKALAIKYNDEVKDLAMVLDQDARIEVITAECAEGLELLRHDAAHVMAQAVQELFPNTQVTIGPVIENGFYYDFAKEQPFREEDLAKIEKRMLEIVDRNETITREVWDRAEAVKHFREIGELYKAEIIESIPAQDGITVYRQGDWKDLCRGPHLPSTGKLGKAFKLMRVAGAYWRGDSNNPMLQRIYGTAWATQKQLDDYLYMLAEAEKRDHRLIGPRMGLFHFSEEAPGSVIWHPKGWRLFLTLTEYLREKQEAAGYQEINTPDMMHLSLWERSGHWEKFGEHMFVSKTEDDRLHALKPMNCPGHVEVFKWGQRSYKELPLRFSEFGKVHRYEPSGALHGAFRVRHFTQDDAHIFCTHEQIEKECIDITRLLLKIYKDFGFDEVEIKLADRPEKRVGSDEVWDQAEAALETAAQSSGVAYAYNKGEGAFYGPKLEFVLRDCLGRDWQCGTVQLDFNLPARLGASYIAADGSKQVPVMIHRALFGSLERFTGILLEHYEGWLPLWLAPTQVVIASITNEFDDYAREVQQAFAKAGLRTELDLRKEKINYKVQSQVQLKVPVLCAVGGRDRDSGTVALRWLKGGALETLKQDEAIAQLKAKLYKQS